jgi:hypothetical protein
MKYWLLGLKARVGDAREWLGEQWCWLTHSWSWERDDKMSAYQCRRCTRMFWDEDL